MKTKNNLLDKYYKGETSLEEEKHLKNKVLKSEGNSSEKDIFGFFDTKSQIPENLEEDLFQAIQNKQTDKKPVKRLLYAFAATAAAIVILVSIYFNLEKNRQLENDFFVMEQALLQVSESIQPAEQEDMLVLWVDDNVEIIIN